MESEDNKLHQENSNSSNDSESPSNILNSNESRIGREDLDTEPYQKYHKKQIRKKWKDMEDLALIKVVLNYSHLLKSIKYYKPMKNFWSKIASVLSQQFGYVRNLRQCHDRFKVLFSKSLKLNELQNLTQYDIFLLQIKKTFELVNGNLSLKNSTETLDDQLPQDQQPYTNDDQLLSHNDMHPIMAPSIYVTLENLQRQIDSLQNQINITNQRYNDQVLFSQNLLYSVQQPPPSLLQQQHQQQQHSPSLPHQRSQTPLQQQQHHHHQAQQVAQSVLQPANLDAQSEQLHANNSVAHQAFNGYNGYHNQPRR